MKARIKEIGSEFWDVPTSEKCNSEFFSDTVWFLSGRSALGCIIADIKSKTEAKTVALPAWCCDSMILPFVKAGIEVKFYSVYVENGKLEKDMSDVSDCDILFLMDYFGYTGNETQLDFSGTVIRDLTHSVFSKTYDDADYYFGSLRKWAGFLTGGFALGVKTEEIPTDAKYVDMRLLAMKEKQEYINGIRGDKDFLRMFAEAEEYLDVCSLAGADMRDIEMVRKLDVEGISSQRRKNAKTLLSELSDMAIFPEPKRDDVPMFVPILVPDGKRDALRRHLIEREIYCPVHWPLTKHHSPDKKTLEIYENELSLVCDQRYDENDMERIIKAIREF